MKWSPRGGGVRRWIWTTHKPLNNLFIKKERVLRYKEMDILEFTTNFVDVFSAPSGIYSFHHQWMWESYLLVQLSKHTWAKVLIQDLPLSPFDELNSYFITQSFEWACFYWEVVIPLPPFLGTTLHTTTTTPHHTYDHLKVCGGDLTITLSIQTLL